MGNDRQAAGRIFRRLRLARGWSWADQARELRASARSMGFARISAAGTASIQRNIARWESGTVKPGEQYQTLLGHLYARTPHGAAAVGPGSDFAEFLIALAEFGVASETIDELSSTVTSSVTDTGMTLLAFLGPPLRAELVTALARPETLDVELVEDLAAVTAEVNHQIGSVPFARLHLAQAAVVDSCRQFGRADLPPAVRRRLNEVAATAFTLAARLAFETHDDMAAQGLYDEAVAVAGDLPDLWHRAAVRTSQTMVMYYTTGDSALGGRVADAAVRDARQSGSLLIRARAHAIQAEMAARGGRSRHAEAALHLAWHDLDADTSGDPAAGAFSPWHMRGFDGVCGIFLGEAEAAMQQLSLSAAALASPRDYVQRAIVLTDRALATLRTHSAGAAEETASQLHDCVELISATPGRVPAQRLRQTRLELKPWRGESFVADLDDHIHTAFIGV
jgi:hypothetical protein